MMQMNDRGVKWLEYGPRQVLVNVVLQKDGGRNELSQDPVTKRLWRGMQYM